VFSLKSFFRFCITADFSKNKIAIQIINKYQLAI
jgi:hypothetical protein